MIIRTDEVVYDGISSRSIGVSRIELNSLVESEFLHARNVDALLLNNQIKSFIQDIKNVPLKFQLTLKFDEYINEFTMRELRKWLNKDDFKELFFMSNDDFIYYAIPNGEVKISHNTLNAGYVTVEMLTNSPYRFTREISLSKDSSSATESLNLYNNGDYETSLNLILTLPNTNITNISIKVYGEKIDEFHELIIKNNLPNETLIINSEREEIKTSSNLRFVYDDHNDVFLKLYKGFNRIELTGNFKCELKYQCIFL